MQPMHKADYVKPPSDELVKITMEHYGLDEAGALQWLEDDQKKVEYWINDLYQVEVRKEPGALIQLNIRRRDGNVIFRDWRHFQQIKNEILGPEFEAVELYPAESRIVDTSNKYHLWALPNQEKFPLGWDRKDVKDDEGFQKGMRQRVLPPSWKHKVT